MANGFPRPGAERLAAINQWREARAFTTVTPAQIWLQMAHRAMALLIALGVVRVFLLTRGLPGTARPLRRLALAWVVLVGIQIVLGAWTIWSNKAADVATAHVAVGALLLGCGVALTALAWRRENDVPAVAESLPHMEEASA